MVMSSYSNQRYAKPDRITGKLGFTVEHATAEVLRTIEIFCLRIAT
jgi:hypothetical protein